MPDLKEGIDYYYDSQGLMVFTRDYLLNRGFCCHQGCRHCPYDFVQEDTEKTKKISDDLKD